MMDKAQLLDSLDRGTPEKVVLRQLIDDLYEDDKEDTETESDADEEEGTETESDADTGYDEWYVTELRDELRRRDLPTTGNKADLVENLEASDKANGDTA